MIIQLNGRELLTHAGKISQAIAQEKMALEYEKFRDQVKAEQQENSLLELERDLKLFSNQSKS